MRGRVCEVLILIVSAPLLFAQITTFPSVETFDSIATPELPPGWSSSQFRTPGTNDFTSVTSTPHSAPNTLLSTNATVGQFLVSPSFSFAGLQPDSVVFYVRRSASHQARVVVEASTDDGVSFPIPLGDSLRNTGSTSYERIALHLPDTLTRVASVRLRWFIIADAAGPTGTFRLDDVTVTARTASDLAVGRLTSIPASPVEGDSVLVAVLVRNVGVQPAAGFSVGCFVDANGDSLPQPNELIGQTTPAGSLLPLDSLSVAFPLGRPGAGTLTVMARTVYGADGNPANDLGVWGLSIGYPPMSVVVNEIMYAPAAPEPEWVEVINTRTDSIDLNGWLVSDNTVTGRKTIVSARSILPPHGIALLTRDTSALRDAHPGISAIMFAIAGFPTLNNSGDAVILFDRRDRVLDSVGYLPSWGGALDGHSLERRDMVGQSTAQENWGSSRGAGGTPGMRNSIARKNVDLAIDSIRTTTVHPTAGDSIAFAVFVRNPGRMPTSSLTLALYDDVNRDTMPEPGELRTALRVDRPLAPRDTLVARLVAGSSDPGQHTFIMEITIPDDEDSSNNRVSVSVGVSPRHGTIVVNEIMYAPQGGEPEWLEILNTAEDRVDLNGWRIGNRSAARYQLAGNGMVLSPGGYAVVTKDTALLHASFSTIDGLLIQCASLPTFLWSNSGDAVVIQDQSGMILDSISYASAWGGGDGRSLERIDPFGDPRDSTNWASSSDTTGASPGRPNSVVRLDDDLQVFRFPAATTSAGSAPFIAITVRNTGRHEAGEYTIRIYDDYDRDSLASPGELIQSFPGQFPLVPGDTLRTMLTLPVLDGGEHLLIASIAYPPDERPSDNDRISTLKVAFPQQTLVVSEIMYAPLAGRAEYVEVQNVSEVPVDVSGWSISDRPTSGNSVNVALLSRERVIVLPDSFYVLATDSSMFTEFPSLARSRCRISRNLALNNDGDDVVLKDLLGTTIDSVAYLPAWHNPEVPDVTGRSLERINARLRSTDGRSWGTCTVAAGGTPGFPNSIHTDVLPRQSVISFAPNPFSPDGDGVEDVTLIHFELPLQASVARISIYDVAGRTIRHLVNNEPAGPRGDIAWDGLDDDRHRARVGPYIVLIEAIDAAGGVIEQAKGVVVLALRL